MRRILPLICLLVSVLVLAAPSADAAVQPALAWQDGAYFHYFYTHNVARSEITLHAVKTTDAAGVETSALTLSLYCRGFGSSSNPFFVKHNVPQVTIPIPGDADHLEVSRDLGWAGLDTTVMAYDSVTAAIIPIEIHLDWYADARVQSVNGEYQRGTHVSGRISTPRCAYDFPYDIFQSSYAFSTRRPRPYYG